ncbi:uncharacterized protein EV420DRAFT_1577096 [Desarmillaria tabescens]|uniref:Uncharacterized protein n=1 Tax=Armillaria tabescens TaxID=1929756 RepID=A0AA39MQR2_ARMTA|nr:uncharacterized protein EV420DRAFT_1577096 [Desarmillaria tabescens]KAK0443132.1 hypothetical protein EV420DRAFT_1577096 [Desarmillaria tabescens]
MGSFLWFVAGAAAAAIYYSGRWTHQSAPLDPERVPEGNKRERRYAYGAGVWLEERMEAPAPPAPPPQQEEQASLEHARELSKQADEVMSDLSEATLDSLMATIVAVKNKLVERRAQREQEEKRASEANEFRPRYV